jgi:hypothetical protein
MVNIGHSIWNQCAETLFHQSPQHGGNHASASELSTPKPTNLQFGLPRMVEAIRFDGCPVTAKWTGTSSTAADRRVA